MKWSIVGLIVVGLVAALAAALLVGLIGAGGRGAGGQVDVVVATQDLPSMILVRSEAVKTRKMARADAPEGFFSDPGRVVGRVLKVPVVKDQIFQAKHMAAEDSAAALASVIPEGMRAVGVSLSDYASLQGLLYPGSVVDVLASFKRPVDGERDEVMSMTLLKGVQVLAVEGETVGTSEEGRPPSGTRGTQKLLVKLLVTPKQAEELHIVQEYAKLSLALRNPLEVSTTGQGGETATLLSDIVGGLQRRGRAYLGLIPRSSTSGPTSGAVRAADWPIVFIRGGSWDVQSVAVPENKGE